MREVLAWGGILLALGATVWGKMLLSLAAAYVKDAHPEIFAKVSEQRTVLGAMSNSEHRVRRMLAAGLLWADLPEPLARDPKIAVIGSRWRATVAAILGGFALIGLGVSL